MSKTSRRDFLKAGLIGAGAVSLSLYALARHGNSQAARISQELMGPLRLVNDETTGLPILKLPEGFRYRTFSWTGSTMSDGRLVPGRVDGMGIVRQQGQVVTMVRNHELAGSSGAIGPEEVSYDTTGGGTTTLVYNLQSQELLKSYVSLSGTLVNCAGGVTPWGSWLSCEEGVHSPALNHLPVATRQYFWSLDNARKEHGYVFEVPADGIADPRPIKAMGQFYHEAVAIDPDSGIAYMTEDTTPKAGFYRYLPDQAGQLSAGGRLQMMAVGPSIDMRDRLELRQPQAVKWVDIAEPEKGFTLGNRDGDGVVSQGLAAGGSAFIALEGCDWSGGRIFFTSKLGGKSKAGQIFEYDPQQELIWLAYESPGHDLISGPDNIIMSPRGSLLVCEDRVNKYKAGQSLQGLTADGIMFPFCQINPDLEGEYAGHDLGETARNSEWAGATFSPDGQWLFCNLYSPGATVAITGPWQDGLI